MILNLPNRITIPKLQPFELGIITICILKFIQVLAILFEFTNVEIKGIEY